jgi:hypothetical protein
MPFKSVPDPKLTSKTSPASDQKHCILQLLSLLIFLLCHVQVLDSLILMLNYSSLRGNQESLETVITFLVDLTAMERCQLLRLDCSRHFGTADLAVRYGKGCSDRLWWEQADQSGR